MKLPFHTLFIWPLLLLSVASHGQFDWEIDKEKAGIVVYTKVELDSEFKSFKAVTTLSASVDDVVTILQNADDYTSWYGFTKTSIRLLDSAESQYNYVETAFPWPYSNRDMVYQMTINVNNLREVKITLLGIPDYLPEKKGIVRMKEAKGFILLQPQGDQTKMTYVFHSEPGEGIPAWLANNSISELPFRTLSGLRELLNH